MAGFQLPSVQVGDLVLFYTDPKTDGTPAMGWVCKTPGAETVTILVFTESGLQERPSVRHADDPFWTDAAQADVAKNWAQWGCFRVHPTTLLLKEVSGLVTQLKTAAARQQGKVKDAA